MRCEPGTPAGCIASGSEAFLLGFLPGFLLSWPWLLTPGARLVALDTACPPTLWHCPVLACTLLTSPPLSPFPCLQASRSDRLVAGLIGYPNVGKSSTINALFGAKKTAVAATPGKTKHFQTLNVSPALCLCDCPGLVLPQYAHSKAEMVAAGAHKGGRGALLGWLCGWQVSQGRQRGWLWPRCGTLQGDIPSQF